VTLSLGPASIPQPVGGQDRPRGRHPGGAAVEDVQKPREGHPLPLPVTGLAGRRPGAVATRVDRGSGVGEGSSLGLRPSLALMARGRTREKSRCESSCPRAAPLVCGDRSRGWGPVVSARPAQSRQQAAPPRDRSCPPTGWGIEAALSGPPPPRPTPTPNWHPRRPELWYPMPSAPGGMAESG